MEQLNVNNKRCCRCKEELQFENFGKNRSTKDGLQKECKSCRRTVSKIYEDNHPHRVKTWRDLNRERYNESNRQRYNRKKQQAQNSE